MSIKSLANNLGQAVVIRAKATGVDTVNSTIHTYTGGSTYQAYVADDGGTTSIIQGREDAPRSLRIYIAGDISVALEDRVEIGSAFYQVVNVRHPGMRSSGPLTYTAIGLVSNEIGY